METKIRIFVLSLLILLGLGVSSLGQPQIEGDWNSGLAIDEYIEDSAVFTWNVPSEGTPLYGYLLYINVDNVWKHAYSGYSRSVRIANIPEDKLVYAYVIALDPLDRRVSYVYTTEYEEPEPPSNILDIDARTFLVSDFYDHEDAAFNGTIVDENGDLVLVERFGVYVDNGSWVSPVFDTQHDYALWDFMSADVDFAEMQYNLLPPEYHNNAGNFVPGGSNNTPDGYYGPTNTLIFEDGQYAAAISPPDFPYSTYNFTSEFGRAENLAKINRNKHIHYLFDIKNNAEGSDSEFWTMFFTEAIENYNGWCCDIQNGAVFIFRQKTEDYEQQYLVLHPLQLGIGPNTSFPYLYNGYRLFSYFRAEVAPKTLYIRNMRIFQESPIVVQVRTSNVADTGQWEDWDDDDRRFFVADKIQVGGKTGRYIQFKVTLQRLPDPHNPLNPVINDTPVLGEWSVDYQKAFEFDIGHEYTQTTPAVFEETPDVIDVTKYPTVNTEQGRIFHADGTVAKFWAIQLAEEIYNYYSQDYDAFFANIKKLGYNMVKLTFEHEGTKKIAFDNLFTAAKDNGLYIYAQLGGGLDHVLAFSDYGILQETNFSGIRGESIPLHYGRVDGTLGDTGLKYSQEPALIFAQLFNEVTWVRRWQAGRGIMPGTFNYHMFYETFLYAPTGPYQVDLSGHKNFTTTTSPYYDENRSRWFYLTAPEHQTTSSTPGYTSSDRSLWHQFLLERYPGASGFDDLKTYWDSCPYSGDSFLEAEDFSEIKACINIGDPRRTPANWDTFEYPAETNIDGSYNDSGGTLPFPQNIRLIYNRPISFNCTDVITDGRHTYGEWWYDMSSTRVQDTIEFFSWLRERWFGESVDYLKDPLGIDLKALIIANNNWYGLDELVAKVNTTSVLDDHQYFDPGVRKNSTNPGSIISDANKSLSEALFRGMFSHSALSHVKGYPRISTESGADQPYQFFGDGILFSALYGSYHDWDNWTFFMAGRYDLNTPNNRVAANWDTTYLLEAQALMPAASRIFRYNYITPGETIIELQIPKEKVYNWYTDTQAINYSFARVPVDPVTGQHFSNSLAYVYRIHMSDFDYQGVEKHAGDYLDGLSLPTGGVYTTPNNQLTIDSFNGFLVADSEYVQAFTGKNYFDLNNEPIPITLSHSTITLLAQKLHSNHASVVIVPLDDTPIQTSTSLLLTAVGTSMQHNVKWTADKRGYIDLVNVGQSRGYYGDAPQVMTGVSADIEISTSGTSATVHILSPDGTRSGQTVTNTLSVGILSFSISELSEAVWYEIDITQ